MCISEQEKWMESSDLFLCLSFNLFLSQMPLGHLLFGINQLSTYKLALEAPDA